MVFLLVLVQCLVSLVNVVDGAKILSLLHSFDRYIDQDFNYYSNVTYDIVLDVANDKVSHSLTHSLTYSPTYSSTHSLRCSLYLLRRSTTGEAITILNRA